LCNATENLAQFAVITSFEQLHLVKANFAYLGMYGVHVFRMSPVMGPQLRLRSPAAVRKGAESAPQKNRRRSGGITSAMLLVQWAVLQKVFFYVVAWDTKKNVQNETAAIAQVALHK
jgi:hypothetical protein